MNNWTKGISAVCLVSVHLYIIKETAIFTIGKDSTFGKFGSWFSKSIDLCAYCEDGWKESDLANSSSYTHLYLFTREKGTSHSELIPGNITNFIESGFDTTKDTKILIHGWLDNGFIKFANQTTHDYLAAQDVNLVVVDWSKVAGQIYPISRIAVTPVGKFLAGWLDWLVSEAGVSLSSVHVIGHSLGAHIGGITGEHVTHDRIARISGLDPAGPGFDSRTAGRLDPTDAEFVDIIHTSGGWAGYFNPCGHVDFYPNKGVINQPGCSPIDFGECSHIRSWKLFAESISSENFVSRECDSWKNYVNGLCDGNPTAIMGEHVDISSRGIFYLHTAGKSPYALGNNMNAD